MTESTHIEHRRTLQTLFRRYSDMMEEAHICPMPRNDFSMENAYWLSNEALRNIWSYPIDKLNRWMGFIQCVLCMSNLTTVQAERDFSRPLFTKNPVY